MAAVFELWSMASGNIVGSFATETAALGAVRDALAAHGKDYAAGLALGSENSCGQSKPIALGPELVRPAIDAAPALDPVVDATASVTQSVI